MYSNILSNLNKRFRLNDLKHYNKLLELSKSQKIKNDLHNYFRKRDFDKYRINLKLFK